TIYSFTINFKPNQSDFVEAEYGKDFERAFRQASLSGNCIMAIRGHGDPTGVLTPEFLKQAQAKNLIKPSGDGKYIIVRDGSVLDLKNMEQVVRLIKDNRLTGDIPGGGVG